MRPPQISLDDDGGFATVTAIVLCAAISIVCAGILGMTLAQKRQAERKLFHAQQSEAINTAVMELSTELTRAQGDATIKSEKVVAWPGGRLTIALRAEYEGRKWPLDKIDGVDESILGKYSDLTKAELESGRLIGQSKNQMPRNDCVRTLFSHYGNTDPKKEFPQGVGLIASAGGHDGQVWRIRATTPGVVEERYVRFTGDSSHLFSIISQEGSVKTQFPDCRTIVSVP